MLDMSSPDKEDERYEHHLEQRSLRNQKATSQPNKLRPWLDTKHKDWMEKHYGYLIGIDFEYNQPNEPHMGLMAVSICEVDQDPKAVWLYNDHKRKQLSASGF